MSSCKTFLVACTVLVSLMFCLPAVAQGPSDATVSDVTIQEQTPGAPTPQKTTTAAEDDNWHFDFAPYLWFAGVSGTAGARGHDVSIHATPGDLLSHFHLGLMAFVDARKNRLVLPLDFLWINLQDSKGLPFDQGLSSAKFGATVIILTPKAGYRIVDHEKVKVDALVGFRYWHLGQNLTVYPTLFNGLSASQNWVDGVAGGKIAFLLSPKISATIAGDAGGGGSSLDYQVAGVLGLRICKSAILNMGYRYLDVDYRTNAPKLFLFDSHLSGALLGVTFNLK